MHTSACTAVKYAPDTSKRFKEGNELAVTQDWGRPAASELSFSSRLVMLINELVPPHDAGRVPVHTNPSAVLHIPGDHAECKDLRLAKPDSQGKYQATEGNLHEAGSMRTRQIVL